MIFLKKTLNSRWRTDQKRREFWPYCSHPLLKLTSLIDCRNDVGYIMRFSNVSSQGEQCMMTLMVDLIILVMFTSDNASGVERTGTGGTSSWGNEGRWKFSMLHFPYAGYIHKSHVYMRVSADTAAYALMIRKFIWLLKIWSRESGGASVWLIDNCIIDSISP